MRKVNVAFFVGAILNIVIAKSTSSKELLSNKRTEVKQLNHNVSYKTEPSSYNYKDGKAAQSKANYTLFVPKLKSSNVNDASKSKKGFYASPTAPLFGGKFNNSINQHIENVRYKNNEANAKYAQMKANPHNGNSTKLIERYLNLKVNTTNDRKIPEVIAPTMIPIFRPMQQNVRSVPQPLPDELVRADDLNGMTSNYDLDPNQNAIRHSQNNEEVNTDIVYLENVNNNASLNDFVNSTDTINILSLEETLNLLKEQQNGWNFQQYPSAIFEHSEIDTVSNDPSHNANSYQTQHNYIDINQERLLRNGQEHDYILNPNFNYEHTSQPDQAVLNAEVTQQNSNLNLPSQSVNDKYNQMRSPQFKMEFIPISLDQCNTVQKLNNNFAPQQNVNSVDNVLNSIPNTPNNEINPDHNANTPSILIERMRFIPLTGVNAINNDLQNIQTIPHNVFVQKQFDTEPFAKSNANPEVSYVSNLFGAKMLDQGLVIENTAASRSQVYQNNVEPIVNRKMSSVQTGTSFNIPCHTAADILEDFAPINQPVYRNVVQPILNPITENPVTNLQCERPLIVSKETIEDESLAIVFKPKNISLLKLYGDLLKKITLTVLVPYHISKLTS